MNLTYGFSRREFLAHTSCFGAFYALASRIPLPNLAAKLAGDSPRLANSAGRQRLRLRAQNRQRPLCDRF